MKNFKYLIAFTIVFSVISCKNEANSSTKIATVEKGIQNIEVAIEGMTCEIGCAKLIESKIHKLEGVMVSTVDFENKIGKITFDNTIISSEEIVKNINGIAGGELYKVTDTKTIK